MMLVMKNVVFVIIPNWNGGEWLDGAIKSVLQQSYKNLVLVIVDNASSDDSNTIIESYIQKDSRVRVLRNNKNYGYTGGVNPGLELAMREGVAYAAPFNNDAIADKHWLSNLVKFLEARPDYGIAACAMLHADGKTIDSTADQYTVWGVPFPRGRGTPAETRTTYPVEIFGASGGASLYRIKMLQTIGIFDQDFFAYYEDIDLSFRAQLAGWKVGYAATSVVYHDQGQTSARLAKRSTDGGPTTFTTEQFMKNLPFILVKDVPLGLLWRVFPRFLLTYLLAFSKSFTQGRGMAALKGVMLFWIKFPKKLGQRRHIQKNRVVSNDYLWQLFVHDLPPNAYKLKKLRALWWRVIRRHS